MQSASLQKYQPHLESVLGPLTEEDDSKIRSIFREIDGVLLEIAHHFGHNRAGWEGTGLELTWTKSGQTAISSNVGASNEEGECVDFCVELRPSWYFSEKAALLKWDVESSVEADCLHSVDHAHMHTVNEVLVRIDSPIDAALALLEASRELQRLAVVPLGYWLELASDT
jgi:hypothetical protein